MIFHTQYFKDWLTGLDREMKYEREARRSNYQNLHERTRTLEERFDAFLDYLGVEVRHPDWPTEKWVVRKKPDPEEQENEQTSSTN